MTIAAGSLVTSAAGLAHPVIISRRRRPADSRPAACRIILIRDSGADEVRLIHAGADDHAIDRRVARHRDGTVADDEDFEGGAFERMAFGDAKNLLLYRAGVGVDGEFVGKSIWLERRYHSRRSSLNNCPASSL